MVSSQNDLPSEAAQKPAIPKSRNLTGIIVSIVVVVIVVAAIGGFLLMNPGSGSASPAGALKGFIDNINDGDIVGALTYTDVAFYDQEAYDDIKASMEESFDDGSTTEIVDVVEISQSQMDSETLEEYSLMKVKYTEYFGNVSDATISEFMFVIVTISTDGEPQTTQMLCVKIDGGWYLALGAMYSESIDDDYENTDEVDTTAMQGIWYADYMTVYFDDGTTPYIMLGEDEGPHNFTITITEDMTELIGEGDVITIYSSEMEQTDTNEWTITGSMTLRWNDTECPITSIVFTLEDEDTLTQVMNVSSTADGDLMFIIKYTRVE